MNVNQNNNRCTTLITDRYKKTKLTVDLLIITAGFKTISLVTTVHF